MSTRRRCVCCLLAAILLAVPTGVPLRSGGPLSVNGQGQPMVWDTAGPILFNRDRDSLGTLSGLALTSLINGAFAEWSATGVVSFSPGSNLPGNVDGTGTPATNPNHYQHVWRVAGDGISPLLYDNDGAIIDGLFGVGSRFDILGLGGIDDDIAVDTTITEGSIVINGLFFDGVGLPASPTDVPSQEALKAVIVHEIGHFLNLDHSVINGEFAADGSPYNDFYIPTMYPLAIDDERRIATLNPDDIAALSTLYGSSPTTGISGSVSAGGVPFQGAQVELRKSGDELWHAYSVISGGRFFPCNAGSACDPCNTACDPGDPAIQGAWAIDFVDGGSYEVSVGQIDTRLTAASGSFVGPLGTPPVVPGPRESWDASEATAAAADDPENATLVVAGIVSSVDILLNDLPLSDAAAEPNNDLASATALPDLAGGRETAAGFLDLGDVDVYAVPVVAGQRLRVDVEAAEFGSSVDAIVALYDASDTLLSVVDDAIDPQSKQFSLDPAIDTVVEFSGTAKLLVTSFPDDGLDGSGGLTSGGYWMSVEVVTDTDGDKIPDAFDACLGNLGDDSDGDGLCVDNCPLDDNVGQADGDTDGVGDACDNCPANANSNQADVDADGIGDACEDTDGDGVFDDGDGSGVAGDAPCADRETVGCDDNCQTLANPDQDDTDNDGYGDGCDPCVPLEGSTNPVDVDGDCVFDRDDNCPMVWNPTQAAITDNGFGDACDPRTGFVIIRPVLTDNGDGDGYADTNETVQMQLWLRNPTDASHTGVTMQLSTDDPKIACIGTALVDVGTVAGGATLLTSEPFAFTVADVSRASVTDEFSVTFRVEITWENGTSGSTTMQAPLTLDLDLDVSGGSGPTSFYEGFEQLDLASTQFELEDLNAGIDTLAEAQGMRCQTHDPDWVNSNTYGTDYGDTCFPSNSLAHADLSWWGLDASRAFNGTSSLHFGNATPTTPTSAFEAVKTTDPINVDWNGVSSDLVIQHQVSMVDGRVISMTDWEAMDRGVVLVQVADAVGAPVGNWIKVYAYQNPYDEQMPDQFFNCMFDPIDDGSTEDDFFDPTDPNRVLGPSSTCVGEPAFAFMGDTVSCPGPGQGLGHASDGVSSCGFGAGTWIESRFDLSRWSGRRVRLRFLVSGIKLEGNDTWVDFGALGEADDGWWIDDVTVTGALTSPAVASVDTNPNTDLLAVDDTDGDGVLDFCDNCPSDPNTGQEDLDGDSIGDICSPRRPQVIIGFPGDGDGGVGLSSSVVLVLSNPADATTVDSRTFRVRKDGVKENGQFSVGSGGTTLGFDPIGTLDASTIYTVELTPDVLGLDGHRAVPFSATFVTAESSGSGSQGAEEVGEDGGGAAVGGDDVEDNSGTSIAALGDVNGDGIEDLLVGSPNANDGATLDTGKAKLIFGSPGLQSNVGAIVTLSYLGTVGAEHVGQAVGRAGDMNNDGLEDFIIGAPLSDNPGADSGAAYLIFGDTQLDEQSPGPLALAALASCSVPTLCGVEFRGAALGDEAGFAVTFAGDLNSDGIDDLAIGAPGANSSAGKVYLVYGPLAAGVVDLANVGSTVPGLVFEAENPGDRAGESASYWPDSTGADDLLIGAPLAATEDEFGAMIQDAGVVYAIQGGLENLDDTATPGIISLGRIAGGTGDEVAGTVFIGSEPDGRIGRHVTGEVDVTGDGETDVMFSQNGKAWVISGAQPKRLSTNTTVSQDPSPGGSLRDLGALTVGELFEVVSFVSGDDGEIGETVVGPAGDVNNDGIEDFTIGAPNADPSGMTDAGIVYIVYGSPALTAGAEQTPLSEIGLTEPGFRLEGAEAGDQLGSSVSGAADLNADGVDDVVAGAPFADTGAGTPEDAGETYVVSPVTPDEVVTVLLEQDGGTTTLEWTVPDQAGSYNVYRTSASVLRADGGVRTSSWTQLACGITTDANGNQLPDTTDVDDPGGAVFVYLVTAHNGNGEGPLGTLGATPTRVPDGPCP